MSAESRLQELGLELPDPPPPVGAYVGAVLHNGFLFVSGHGPLRDGEYCYLGKVDSVVSIEGARAAADLTVMNILGTVRTTLGSLDRVTRVVKLLGMVNSDPEFAAQPRVVDAASDLLISVFGDLGPHARSAIGVGALPMGISVEIEVVMAVE